MLNAMLVLHSVRGCQRSVLPVLWHQTLLSFVNLYRNELSSSQCVQLRALVAGVGGGCTWHMRIRPEVRRVLEHRLAQLAEPVVGAQEADADMAPALEPLPAAAASADADLKGNFQY